MLTKLATFQPRKPIRWLQQSHHGLGIDIGQLQTKIVFAKRTLAGEFQFNAATIPTCTLGDDSEATSPGSSQKSLQSKDQPEIDQTIPDRRHSATGNRAKQHSWSTRDLRELMHRVHEVVGNNTAERCQNVGVCVSMAACDLRTLHVPKNSRINIASIQQTIASATGDRRTRCVSCLPGLDKPNDEQQTKIRCLSIPEDLTWSIGQQLEHVGLAPKIISGLPWCVADALNLVLPPAERGATQIGIDWSVGEPTLVSVVNGEIDYVRRLASGGMWQIMSQAMQDYGMTPAQASRWLTHCLQVSEGSQPNSAAAETRDWVVESVTRFAEEIEAVLDFVHWRNQNAPVGSVWMMGGGLQVPGLYDLLHTCLSCSVLPWQLQTASAGLTSEYAMAAALASQGAQHAQR